MDLYDAIAELRNTAKLYADVVEDDEQPEVIDTIDQAIVVVNEFLAEMRVTEGVCWRCNLPVTSQAEVVWLDGQLRNDCPESSDGAPHEIRAPEGWDDE